MLSKKKKQFEACVPTEFENSVLLNLNDNSQIAGLQLIFDCWIADLDCQLADLFICNFTIIYIYIYISLSDE